MLSSYFCDRKENVKNSSDQKQIRVILKLFRGSTVDGKDEDDVEDQSKD